MRPWPNAPRDCLLASTPCSDVTWVASSVMFFCARSMTASRSLSFCRFSVVLCLVFSSELPSRCETESSRSLTVCCELRLALGEQADHGLEPRRRVGLRAAEFGHHRVFRSRADWRDAPEHERQRGKRGAGDKDGENRDDRWALGHGCFYAIRRGSAGACWNKAGTCHSALRSARQRIARIDRALCTAYIAARAWCNMAVREILKLPDKRLRLVSEPVKRIDAGIRKLVEDMFETMYDGARHRACGDPGRRRQARRHHGLVEEGGGARAAGFHQSGNHLGVGREGDPRGRLPVDPGILRGGRAAGGRSRSNISTSTARRTRSRRTACWPPASSTRSTTSTACCSSTIISKLKRDRVIKKFSQSGEGGEEGGGVIGAPPRLHGHARLRRAHAP